MVVTIFKRKIKYRVLDSTKKLKEKTLDGKEIKMVNPSKLELYLRKYQ